MFYIFFVLLFYVVILWIGQQAHWLSIRSSLLQFDALICVAAWRSESFSVHRGRLLFPLVFSPAFCFSLTVWCWLVLYFFFQEWDDDSPQRWLPAAPRSPAQAQSRLHQLPKPLHMTRRWFSSPLMIMRSFTLEEHSSSVTRSTVCWSVHSQTMVKVSVRHKEL